MNKFLIVVLAVILNGCAESRFDCPYSNGPSCMSMDKLDSMIKHGSPDTSARRRENVGEINLQNSGSVTSPKTANAIRVPEKVMQLWVAPYESESGIYYHSAYINVIVRDPFWRAPVTVGGNL